MSANKRNSFDPDALKRKLGYLSKDKDLARETLSVPGEKQPICLQPAWQTEGQWQKLGEYTFFRQERIALALPPALKKFQLLENRFDLEDLLFFDVETTGLSGGAGSIIFLLGLGWFTKEQGQHYFHIEQLFLDDFPGEPEFIRYLVPKLTHDRLYVSYNGKSFDSHLLKSRFSMNAQELELPHQLDLLHLIRAFCKTTLDTCSLSCVERELLSVHRQADLPGALVPEVYLKYLCNRQADLIPLIFAHNFQDILSLAQLYLLVERALAGEELAVPLDWARVGEYLLRKGKETGLHLLETAFKQGNWYAGRVLSLYYKRRRLWEEALAIWQTMASQQNLFAKLELAKYYEHRVKDLTQALYWVNAIEKDYRKYGYKLFPSPEAQNSLSSNRIASNRRTTAGNQVTLNQILQRKERLLRKEQQK
jgi:hypothetical protein